jgi:cysteine-rich repeat protein
MVCRVQSFEGMKQLVAAMMFVMGAGCASPATPDGCGDLVIDPLKETCDDGNTESGDGCSSDCQFEETVTAHWTLENSAGEAQQCPAGFDTVDVIAQTLRVNLTEASFPCADGQGTFEMHETPRSPTSGFLLQIRRGDTGELFSQTPSPDPPGVRTHDHRFDIRFKVTTDIGRLSL